MITMLSMEIYIICLIITIMVARRIYSNIDKKQDNRIFFQVLLLAIVLFVVAAICELMQIKIIDPPRWMHYFFNILYIFLTCHIGYLWFLYGEGYNNKSDGSNLFSILIKIIPFSILIVFTIASCWNGMIFYIDENGLYQKGDYNYIQGFFSVFYIIVTAVLATIRGLKTKSYDRSLGYFNLAAFACFPAIGAVIQSFFIELPAFSASITLAILSAFISIQNRQITIDELTGLNNRLRLNRYLHDKVGANGGNRPFYILMIDVDYFKDLNDTYGHVVGDEALVAVASNLKHACSSKNSFCSRYGGDEFIIVYDNDDLNAAKQFKEQLINDMPAFSRALEINTPISLSIGVFRYDGSDISITQLIASVDEYLYKEKRNRIRSKSPIYPSK